VWRRLVSGEDWHAQGWLRYNFFKNTRNQKFQTSVPKTKQTQHNCLYPQGWRPWPSRKSVMWVPSPKSNPQWCPPESWPHGERHYCVNSSVVHAGRAQTLATFLFNRFCRWIRPNQENSVIFKPSKFKTLYQAYFGFWLFACSRCGRIVKKSRRKYSWYQDYSVLLMLPSPSCYQMPSPFVTETARNVWTQTESILVERTINQNIEVFLF